MNEERELFERRLDLLSRYVAAALVLSALGLSLSIALAIIVMGT